MVSKTQISLIAVGSIVAFIVVFILMMISSWFTILALNVLFAKEIIAATFESVVALAWIKIVVGGMLSGIVKITNEAKK